MSPILLIAGSRNLKSRTKIVIDEIDTALQIKGFDTAVLDLASLDMDLCDGRDLKDYSKNMSKAYDQVKKADLIVIGMPVYCYSVAGPLKNFIDITSEAFTGKKIAIACNAGSPLAYLAATDLHKILGYESNALPLFPTVFTSATSFADGKLVDERAKTKIEDLIEVIARETKI
jgi:NAD(P)H-dependent FMN reductase